MKELAETEYTIAEFAERFINQTSQHIFLTGKAGTGKTTLLRKIVEHTHKQTAIVAPTGIAALNAGGVTIHSFFGLPFGGFIPDFLNEPVLVGATKLETKNTIRKHFHYNAARKRLLQTVELLVIDEVSMLRADLLDAIDWALRHVRKINRPFGGVQMLFIGDLQQLPPVVKPEEWNVLKEYYNGIFFFNATSLKENQPIYLELDKIFRQDDPTFISILNELRNNQLSEESRTVLNSHVRQDYNALEHQGVITLTTHNSLADSINNKALEALDEKKFFYKAEINKEFPEHIFPIDEELQLKVGAQIMFIKNDLSFDKNYYNGKMGIVASLGAEEIIVEFPEERKKITVDKYEWQNIRYAVNPETNEIEETTLGTFTHYPIRLAWAITVHKSQGLTFDKAVLDISNVFAPGQAYVALSRLRSLDGLVFLRPLQLNGLQNDETVSAYGKIKADDAVLNNWLSQSSRYYMHQRLVEAFDWYDYMILWTNLHLSMKMQGDKSEKGKDKSWVEIEFKVAEKKNEAAKKFQSQLNKLFSNEELDLEFIQQRIHQAYEFFFPVLDNQVYLLLKRLTELNKKSKSKIYVEELDEVLAKVVKMVQELKKLKVLLQSIVDGRSWDKSIYSDKEIQHYLIAKNAKINQDLRNERNLLIEEEDDDDEMRVPPALQHLMKGTSTPLSDLRRETKKGISTPFDNLNKKAKKDAEPKERKKTTHEVTYDMWKGGKTVEEIASERQLSKTTVEGHFVQLIKQELVELTALMDAKRISEIEEYFEGYEEMSLTPLKDKLGDKVSWSELKWVQASKML